MKKYTLIFAAAYILLQVGLVSAPALEVDNSLSPAANQAFIATNAKKQGVISRPDGLQYRILRNGFGRHIGPNDNVQVQYSGRFINGKVFDQTALGLPATLNVGNVFRGLGEALKLMREGDRWQLTIPPDLAFGKNGLGKLIPPDQVLVFDVTALSITTRPSVASDGQGQISITPYSHEWGKTSERGAMLTIPQ